MTAQAYWVKKLGAREDVTLICQNIFNEDTGTTDMLARTLAELYLEQQVELDKVKSILLGPNGPISSRIPKP